MNTFTYSYPVKTFFGEGAARSNLPDLLAKYGQNVMLAYGGGSVKRVGIFDEIAQILKAAGKTEEELALAGIEALAEFIKEIGLPTKFSEMGIGADTDFRAIADSTVITKGCCKRLTADEIFEILQECL